MYPFGLDVPFLLREGIACVPRSLQLFDDFELDLMLLSGGRRVFTGVTLINKGKLHGLTAYCLDLLSQCGNLRPLLLIGGRYDQG